tara:strand:- start:239 stop:919 length:681 start_codon:yes stop_codon:yes gene_type:complete
MENILNDFFKRRNKHIQNNINLVDEKRNIYLKKRQEIKRSISCIIGYLFALKFDLEVHNNIHRKPEVLIESLENIKNKIELLITNYSPLTKCYCVYKSPTRAIVDTNSIKIISNNPICANITIKDCNSNFMIENKTIYGIVSKEHITLNISEDTTIKIPKNFIQLKGDSISIEYVDVFAARGINRVYKYKGIDLGQIYRLKKILNRNMSIDNIQNAINLAMSLISE